VRAVPRGHGKLKEIRFAWIIRNRFKVLLLLATNGLAIDIAKGIKGIHDDKVYSVILVAFFQKTILELIYFFNASISKQMS
jgi:hypothetical protein